MILIAHFAVALFPSLGNRRMTQIGWQDAFDIPWALGIGEHHILKPQTTHMSLRDRQTGLGIHGVSQIVDIVNQLVLSNTHGPISKSKCVLRSILQTKALLQSGNLSTFPVFSQTTRINREFNQVMLNLKK